MLISAGLLLALAGISAGVGLAGYGIQAGSNYALQKDAQAFNASEALKQREFEAEEAQKARDFAAQQRDTAVTSQINQLKASGINIGALGSAGSVSGVSTPGSLSAHGSTASSPLNNAGPFENVTATAFTSALNRLVTDHKNQFVSSFRGSMFSQTGKMVTALKNALAKPSI